MAGWSELMASPDGPVGVGSGWASVRAWIVAGVVIAVLVLVARWIAGPGRKRRGGRGAELALRRYDLRQLHGRGRTRPSERRHSEGDEGVGR